MSPRSDSQPSDLRSLDDLWGVYCSHGKNFIINLIIFICKETISSYIHTYITCIYICVCEFLFIYIGSVLGTQCPHSTAPQCVLACRVGHMSLIQRVADDSAMHYLHSGKVPEGMRWERECYVGEGMIVYRQ